jgi:putative acyl-CoA dehydrogenase
MRNVLADLAVESEAATVLVMRLARAFDQAPDDRGQRAFARIATALGKYWISKRAPQFVFEALECLGGNGYIEESIMPRLYREAPVNSIWEGCGSVICLDVLRAIGREPESLQALMAEISAARGADRRLDGAIAALQGSLADPNDLEANARHLVERMALALQGSLLVRHGHPRVAEAFCAGRLRGEPSFAYGTLPSGFAVPEIIERTRPFGRNVG